jgi:hypothetical protein
VVVGKYQKKSTDWAKRAQKFLAGSLLNGAALLLAAWLALAAWIVINYSPTLVWGEKVLLGSMWVTMLPSFAVFFLVFSYGQKILRRVMVRELKLNAPLSVVKTSFACFVFVASSAALYLQIYGFNPERFHVDWVEAVTTNADNGVLVERRNVYYAGSGYRFDVYKNTNRVESTIKFKVGANTQVAYTSRHKEPVFLGEYQNNWYLVLSGYDPTKDSAHGAAYLNASRHEILVLRGNRFETILWSKAPNGIVDYNLIHDLKTTDLESMQGKVFTSADKKELLEKRGYGSKSQIKR